MVPHDQAREVIELLDEIADCAPSRSTAWPALDANAEPAQQGLLAMPKATAGYRAMRVTIVISISGTSSLLLWLVLYSE